MRVLRSSTDEHIVAQTLYEMATIGPSKEARLQSKGGVNVLRGEVAGTLFRNAFGLRVTQTQHPFQTQTVRLFQPSTVSDSGSLISFDEWMKDVAGADVGAEASRKRKGTEDAGGVAKVIRSFSLNTPTDKKDVRKPASSVGKASEAATTSVGKASEAATTSGDPATLGDPAKIPVGDFAQQADVSEVEEAQAVSGADVVMQQALGIMMKGLKGILEELEKLKK